MALVDVVVVSYNSRDRLRSCVAALAANNDFRVVVVDNASPDRSLESVADLPIEAIQRTDNGGFARGCNAGWRVGDSPYVLFLNPDATLEPPALLQLVDAIRIDSSLGAVAPRIVDSEGTLDFSLRRFPRLRSTFAQALFMHRLFPRARWADEVIRDEAAYGAAHSVEWVAGACVLVRRSILDRLDGFDERFFLYCEDTDLCRRIHNAGYGIQFDPSVTAVHVGGSSAARGAVLPLLAESRLRYAQIHGGPVHALLERVGIALGAATHLLVGRGGRGVRGAQARSLKLALGIGAAQRPSPSA